MYIIWFIIAVVIVIIGAVFSSFGVLFNTRMFEAGEDILLRANASIQDINDATARTAIQNSIDGAFDAQQNNIEVNNAMFQYSWVFMLIISGIVVFLLARQTVEIQSRFGGGFV